MKEVEIEALKPFNKTPQGDLCEVGETFPVAETRADELERLGLAKRTGDQAANLQLGEGGRTKSAPTPSNKMAPAASNKTKPVKLGG